MNRIAIELIAPPALTGICWLVSRLMPDVRRGKAGPMNWVQFWLLLISAYLMFALALWGGSLFTGEGRGDPSTQLVR